MKLSSPKIKKFSGENFLSSKNETTQPENICYTSRNETF